MKILSRDTLEKGGFAGLREHRIVMDPRVFGGRANPGTERGIGNFIYLADARFLPRGETHMHDHMEVDVISIMVEGRIDHEGSLEHGQGLACGDVQVQRAGGEGFSHNEVNPDDHENRMLQLWVAPEVPGGPAAYRVYHPKAGQVTRIYGGAPGEADVFPAKTVIDIAYLEDGRDLSVAGDYLVYLFEGAGTANGQSVRDGDLLKGEGLTYRSEGESRLAVVSLLGQ